ncbi:hypothetical protein CRUP_014045, partial [Coryphaenoides rupestris]
MRPVQARAALAELLCPPAVPRMLLLLLLAALVSVQTSSAQTSSASQEDVVLDDLLLEEFEADSTHRPLTTLEALSLGGPRLSPQKSWLIFRRNSNKGDNRRTRTYKRASKAPLDPRVLKGPPDPRRPRGSRTLRSSSSSSEPSDYGGRLQRGRGFNGTTGRYRAPLAGFYQLTASLLIESAERGGQTQRPRDSVKASICIESLCQTNVSLESVMGVRSGGGVFSVLLTGTLYLQAGEYVSVFVDNATGSSISILTDSLFSGILLG